MAVINCESRNWSYFFVGFCLNFLLGVFFWKYLIFFISLKIIETCEFENLQFRLFMGTINGDNGNKSKFINIFV